MSAIPGILQNGLLQGAALYQRQDEERARREQAAAMLALQQQRMQEDAAGEALRREWQREQIRRARDEAAQLLDQHEADRAVYGAMLAPDQPAAGLPGPPAPDWAGRLGPDVIARASPRVQGMAGEELTRRGRTAQAAEEARARFEAARASGTLKYLDAAAVDKMLAAAPDLDVRPEDLPAEVRDRISTSRENVKKAKIVAMTTDDQGNIDDAAAARLETLPEALVDREYLNWQGRQVGVDPGMASALGETGIRALAREKLQAPKVDTAGQRLLVQQAEDEVRSANAQSVNGRLVPGPLAPPTLEERELAAKATFPTTFWNSDATDQALWEKARRKVAAWEKYQAALAAVAGSPGMHAGAPAGQAGEQPPPASFGNDDVATGKRIMDSFTASHGRRPTREEFKALMQQVPR